MTYNSEEAEKAAVELVKLSIQAQELNDQIKCLKANLLEYADVENINDTAWSVDNGFVEIQTVTNYKLAEIPVETKIDANACPIDISEQAFTTKLVLTKEGKQMLQEQYPTIMKLVVPTTKKQVKVSI